MELDRCRDLRDCLPTFVTSDLDANRTLRVQKHLGDTCGPCATEIEALHAAFQRIPLALAPCPLPEGSLGALVDKIASQPQEEREQPIVFRDTNEGKLAWTLVLLAMAALIAVGFWGWTMERTSARDLSAAEAATRSAQRQTRSVVGDYRSLEGKARTLEAELAALKDAQPDTAPPP
jgi:hypothetical protein